MLSHTNIRKYNYFFQIKLRDGGTPQLKKKKEYAHILLSVKPDEFKKSWYSFKSFSSITFEKNIYYTNIEDYSKNEECSSEKI